MGRLARLAAQRKKEGKTEEEPEPEESKEEPKEEADAEMEDAAPVELTEEEKKTWHLKSANPDMSEQTLAKSYASFSLPSSDEGFEQVSYVSQSESECSKLLKDYIL